MTKFKVGDKVKVIDGFRGYANGTVGTITSVDGDYVGFNHDGGWDETRFELVEELPIKPVNFILQYELDKDPFETFETMAEVEKRIKELADRADLKRDSLRIYRVAETIKVELSTKVSLHTISNKPAPAKRGRPAGGKNKRK